MDDLWKRHLAESKLSRRKPRTENRIILEGSTDKSIFDKLINSNLYHIQYLEHSKDSNNKFEVVRSVSKSIKSTETPPTIGLVDMDGDFDGKRLAKSIEYFSTKSLPTHIKDSRNDTCLFVLISKLIDEKWIWLRELSNDSLVPSEWRDFWKVVLQISKLRTHIHLFKQRKEIHPEYIPNWAVQNTKFPSSEYGFEEWLDLYNEVKGQFKLEHVNDHCLESTISDYILFEHGNLHHSIPNLMKQVQRLLQRSLIAKIKLVEYSMDSLLHHTGNPFVK
jgi:hypothetical protein